MNFSTCESRKALDNKRILVGITGGIAAYKSAELVRLLVRAGARVHVVMTRAATRFITPLTLETLSQNPVGTDIFELRGSSKEISHTEIGRHTDAAIVAPATADFIGRLAGGLADQLLLCALMASEIPVLLCPAMNVHMWENPLVQRNLELLRTLPRYRIVEPDDGFLACQVVGKGRLPDPPALLSHVVRMVTTQDLAGKRVVVTAGPTREWADPVRFLSNPSTGRMGYAIAEAAWERGASVTLVSGPTQLAPPVGADVVAVGTTAELLSATRSAVAGADVLIMAAAPADYRPETTHRHKQKKDGGDRTLSLLPTDDVLATVVAQNPGLFALGFAAETHDAVSHAAAKVARKGVDLLFVNQVGGPGRDTGFATATNGGTLLDRTGAVMRELPVEDKGAVAHALLNAVVEELS